MHKKRQASRRGRRTALRLLLTALLLGGGVLLAGTPQCCASGADSQGKSSDLEESVYYVNPDTDYQVRVEDEAGLLTEEERRKLAQVMRGITAYGNAAFVTVWENEYSTETFVRNYYMEGFGTDSGTVFVIDMDNRNVWIHSDGAVYEVVTTARANTVTDNVYRYASKGDYYGCAREAFEEIHALLEGQRIAQPMKYISNALLALILALLANFGLVIGFTRLGKPKTDAVLAHMHRNFRCSDPSAVFTHQTRIYDPVSSSSGSGGGRSGGGGHSGGGGRSGGGGGHRF